MRTKAFKKDPDEVLDYTIDWTKWLSNADSDTISSSAWEEDSGGVTIDSDTNTTTDATVWLSGGTAGNTYLIENKIITAGGRTVKRAIVVTISELTSNREIYYRSPNDYT